MMLAFLEGFLTLSNVYEKVNIFETIVEALFGIKRFFSDTTQMDFRTNLRDLRDVFEETSLIDLTKNVSGICKLALFETFLRRYIKHLKDASEMDSYRLKKDRNCR